MHASSLRIITTLFFTFFIIQTYAQGSNMNPLDDQPYFTLKVNGFGTLYFAEVNGVSVYREFDTASQVTTSFPINHLMTPNNNSIELFVLPNAPGEIINPSAKIEIELYVASNTNRDNTTLISNIVFNGSNKKDEYTSNSLLPGNFNPDDNMKEQDQGTVNTKNIVVTEVAEFQGGLYYSRSITVPNSLPLWSFLNSDTLPKQSDLDIESHNRLRNELFNEYNKIQVALKNKKIDEVIDLFTERNNELDAAFYYKSGTMHKKLYNALYESVSDSDYELSDLKEDYLGIYIDTGRKLVSLKRNGAQSAIGFDDKVSGGSDRYDIIYRRSNNKWIITR